MTYLVMMQDSEGTTRAWGAAPDLEAASHEAKRQLSIYRGTKAQLGDPLARDTYTETGEVIDEA